LLRSKRRSDGERPKRQRSR